MGWRDLLLEKDGSQTKAPSKAPATGAPVFGTARPATASGLGLPPLVNYSSAGLVDQGMVAEIESALAGRSSQLYLKFTSLLASLSGLPDERTRFAAALAVAPSMQLTPSAVATAYDERLTTLDTLQQQFEQQSRDTLEKRVTGSQQALAQINNDLEAANREIARLTQQVETLRLTQAQKTELIKQDTDEIGATSAKMLTAFLVVRGKATVERDTVNRYITGS